MLNMMKRTWFLVIIVGMKSEMKKEVYGDETVDYEMANGELVCIPCYKILGG